MRSLFAFMKKEFLEQLRSGRLTVLGVLFILIGIMNPAVAKMTPWLMEILSDSLAESGVIVTDVTVSAMDSWVQFFKNIPIALIVFILLQSSIFTKEYNVGTLLLALTKGLARYKVVLSKTVLPIALWTAYYWLCFWITYAYNSYFWDNAVAQNLLFAVGCWWLFGVWVISLLILFSTLSFSNTGVLVGTGAVVLVSYLVGLIPKINRFLPTMLTDGNPLIYGIQDPKEYAASIVITAITSLICFAVSIPVFDKKQL